MSGLDDAEADRLKFQAPYTQKHPIPTVQRFKEAKRSRKDNALAEDDFERDDTDLGRPEDDESTQHEDKNGTHEGEDDEEDEDEDGENQEDQAIDTSQFGASHNTKQRRKVMQKRKDERAERVVTDPVTHLPVKIHDFTRESIKGVDKNEPASGTTPRTATGLSNKDKSGEQLKSEMQEILEGQGTSESHFPPPDYDIVREEFQRVAGQGVVIGLIGSATVVLLVVLSSRIILSSLDGFVDSKSKTSQRSAMSQAVIWLFPVLLVIGLIWGIVTGIRSWMSKRIDSAWEGAVWQSKFDDIKQESKNHNTETTIWLNSLLASVWPLINPDLFTSLADTLEDVMQASLPKLVRMVSVDDIGQGSEAIRILGIRWLPTGAAARSVAADGSLQAADKGGHMNDRAAPGEGEVEQQDSETEESGSKQQKDGKDESSDAQDSQQMAEGMEAEEGDFVNIELAFAYRASTGGHTLKARMKDMHLYLAFYLPGNIKVPVWVDLRGIVGTMRLRLQLAPDPPFFALATLTFLGQPKVELSCVPLLKHAPNIMNLPLISNFVQSSVDAAMAEYVAPKSLTLNLQDMIVGDDFKKDVAARGVLVITIIRGYDFKMGDLGIPLVKDGSADPYVSVGWAKFGKPLWSTRILENEMEPIWMETAYILVTPEELNVDERLRLQLWDSDRFTGDDDLGRIEVDLKEVMKSPDTNGRITQRTDGFRALKAGEDMPGKLEWRVGYFSKTRIQRDQLDRQTFDPDVKTTEDLKKKVDEVSQRKLREAQTKDGRTDENDDELKQQRLQEFKQREDEMIISAPPPNGYPSGIFSIQIHQITGLELQKLNKNTADKKDAKPEGEDGSDDLPSSYCTVIINHKSVYKTRTKPKNARPFFNAGTEHFLPDWQSAEVHVAVQDSRVHEDDALLGIVHLPLHEVFKDRAQVNGFYPLSGGVGYGRIRLSMVWRSVQLQAPREMLGWDLGTLEVQPHVQALDVPSHLARFKLKLKTNISAAKVYPSKESNGWKAKRDNSLRLAVRDRYSSCLTVMFRHKGIVGHENAAFAVMWLRDIPDDEEREMELPVWKGDFDKAIKCSLDECGEKVGSIKIKLTFWSGLGAAHSKWAVKRADLRDVVQVLETARDNLETSEAEKKAGIVDEEMSSESETDSSDEEERRDGTQDDSKSPSRSKRLTGGIVDEVKDYKKHHKSIHRQNRGLMTWKAPRTAQWAVHTAEKAESKIAGIFKRHSRGAGIETEV